MLLPGALDRQLRRHAGLTHASCMISATLSDAPHLPGKIGGYSITQAVRLQGEAVLLFTTEGPPLDRAGFAYLPDGPKAGYSNGSFEAPAWQSLGNDWYGFVASW
jgi:hypothetical protein